MDSQQSADICAILATPDKLALWCFAQNVGINHGRRLLQDALYTGKDISSTASKKQLVKNVFKREEEKAEKQKSAELALKFGEDYYDKNNSNNNNNNAFDSLQANLDLDIEMAD